MDSEYQADIVVYTAIFGDYDVLIEPSVIEDHIDYVCFTDDPKINSNIWEVRHIKPRYGPSLTNRYIKTHPHEFLSEYEISIYVDGNIQIQDSLSERVVEFLEHHDFAVHSHPDRNSLFAEAEVCIEKGLVDHSTATAQIEKYRTEGFQDKMGLSENRVLYRRHKSEDLQIAMEEWWTEIYSETSRDQLSLMYILWDNNLRFQMISNPVQEDEAFQIHPHKPSGWKARVWPYWMKIKLCHKDNYIANIIYKTIQASRTLIE